jgi:probable phosphoglycerate mutase
MDERLCEQSFGLWDGLTFAEAKRRYPEDYAAWQAGAGAATPTGGESLAQVAARHLSLCHDLRSRHAYETVALVGHGGGLSALLCGLLHTPLHALWPYRLALGSVSEMVVYPEGVVLTRLSHT